MSSQQPWGPQDQQQPYQQQAYGPPPYSVPPRPKMRTGQQIAMWTTAVLIAVAVVVIVVIARNGKGSDAKKPTYHTATRAQYESSGRDWPLTVDWAILNCTRLENTAYSITARVDDGTIYALNPWAERVFPRIDPIWAKDGNMSVSLGDLTDEAYAICPKT